VGERLVRIADAALAEAARKSGTWLQCRPGCDLCCHGVFPISQSDALRLRRGLAELAHSDSDRAGRVVQRARDAVARMRETFPGDAVTGVVWEDDPRFEEFGEDEVCPALDPATHTCDLYQWRPLLCRTFGPAVRQADGCITACELCYQGATEEQMAACAVTMPAEPQTGASTLVAFCLGAVP
jgi:Fe-S-cluster containining protein